MAETTVPTFEPVTLADIKSALGKLIPASLKNVDQSVPGLTDYPCRNTLAMVGLTSLVFYLAERGHNPKVNSILDASIYCSTCLSVGYGDIFARTPVGKAIGTLLMTIGPAMTNKALDGASTRHEPELQQQILDTLRQILVKMESGPESTKSERQS